jgi:hypothetical protein
MSDGKRKYSSDYSAIVKHRKESCHKKLMMNM